MPKVFRVIFYILLVFLSFSKFAAADEIKWQPWSADVLKNAKAQKRGIILDLEAVWCHWCHVMDERTYSDGEVISLINKNFIPVRADQDANPELSVRYRDYGWPATIVFSSSGEELAKMAGFVEPEEFKKVLRGAAEGKKMIEEAGAAENSSSTATELRTTLIERHNAAVDREIGGLKTNHRYLDPDSVEYALRRAIEGDQQNRSWVELTLKQSLKLLDPVWGGMYQYSTGRDWNSPHFEKIIPTQAAGVRLYSLAALLLKDPSRAADAKKITGYLATFLRSPEGAFYTSQDADLVKGEHSAEYFNLDDNGRRAKGIPAIDKHIYTRENGLVIDSLALLYSVTSDEKILSDAKAAADWLLSHRKISTGGFRHGEADIGGPFLPDNLAAARGFLALYSVTADRRYLKEADDTLQFIEKTFTDSAKPGVFVSPVNGQNLLPGVRSIEENIAAARFANLISFYTGNQAHKDFADRVMTFLNQSPDVFESITEPGVLLAGEELASEPAHFTVVAPKGDETGKALWQEVLRYPAPFRRLEWWDRSEGDLPNPDVRYPKLPVAAAFVCAQKRCSLPLTSVEELRAHLERLNNKDGNGKT